MDRRRRMVRESAASNAATTADYARSQKKQRRTIPSHHAAILSGIETPNYSQDVRKTCQLRVVQWIPLRSTSVSILIGTGWAIWCGLLLCHYFFHSNANSVGRSPVPFLQLLDLRSPHSIANWMTCQLWFLTAFASWLVYSIRKHRLDDFSATYRVWFVMIGLSIFSCFDTATSAMYLLGQSIDPWTRREIGYGGWPLILAAYASIAALVGLRLSTEIRISRAALGLWFGGLLAWASAALLGTGLLKIQWSPGSIDLIVGGLWLGGVLAIFQSVGLVLRQCYLQAQRRFLERAVLSKSKFDWADQQSDQDDSDDPKVAPATDDAPEKKKSWLPWRRNSDGDQEELGNQDDLDSTKKTSKSKTTNKNTDLVDQKPKKPMRLFGLFPHRNERNEQLDGIEPVRIEEQIQTDLGLTKKPSWFARRKSSDIPTTQISTTPEQSKQSPRASNESAGKESVREPKRAWLGSWTRAKNDTKPAQDQQPVPSSNNSKPKELEPQPKQPQVKQTQAQQTQVKKTLEDVQEPVVKKSWFSLGKKKQQTSSDPEATQSKTPTLTPAKATTKTKEPDRVDSFEVLDELPPKSGKLAKRIFGWMEGLKFKPPKEVQESGSAKSTTTSNPKSAAQKSNNPSSSSGSSDNPSSSDANKTQQTQSEYEDEGSDEDYSDYRNLSKAERKKMRRQQNDRGAA